MNARTLSMPWNPRAQQMRQFSLPRKQEPPAQVHRRPPTSCPWMLTGSPACATRAPSSASFCPSWGGPGCPRAQGGTRQPQASELADTPAAGRCRCSIRSFSLRGLFVKFVCLFVIFGDGGNSLISMTTNPHPVTPPQSTPRPHHPRLIPQRRK